MTALPPISSTNIQHNYINYSISDSNKFRISNSEITTNEIQAIIVNIKNVRLIPILDKKDTTSIEKVLRDNLKTGAGIEIDYKKLAQEFVRHWENTNEQIPNEFDALSKTRRSNAVKLSINNRLEFIKQICENFLENDLNIIATKYNIEIENVSSIHLSPASADLHHKASSPIFFTIKMTNGEEIKLIFKPRIMLFEQLLCDKTNSILQAMNDYLLTQNNYFKSQVFKTYDVFVISDRSYYGYSQFLEGKPVFDENQEGSIKTAYAFIKENSAINRVNDFLACMVFGDYADLIKKIGDNPKILEAEEISQGEEELFEEVQELKRELEDYPDFASLKNLKEMLNNPDQVTLILNPDKLADLIYFSNKNEQRLARDYLLFLVLAKLNLSDLHGNNFFEDPEDMLAILDVEVFNDPNALPASLILLFFELLYKQHGWHKPMIEEDFDRLPSHIQQKFTEFEELKNKIPYRSIAISTSQLCKMCKFYLNGGDLTEKCQYIIDITLKSKGIQPIIEVNKFKEKLVIAHKVRVKLDCELVTVKKLQKITTQCFILNSDCYTFDFSTSLTASK